MTDIADQDRRDMLEWADDAIAQGDGSSPRARTVAHYVRATVDAPAPTLAEELANITEHWKEWTTKTITAALAAATDRAKHMEHDLAEARDEVERVTRERERSLAQVQGLARRESDLTSEVRMLTDERDEALAEVDHLKRDLAEAYKTRDARDDEVYSLRAEVNRLTAERDEARDEANALDEELAGAESEVERLTSVNENLRRTDNYREFKEFIGVQKGAESNAESIDPADVKPGEAWKAHIWYDEERHPGTAIKSSGGDWTVTRDDGSHTTYRMNEYVELVSRLVPAPRVITNHDELEHLAATSIIRDGRGWPGGITDQGGVMINGFCLSAEDILSLGPVTVLWEPGV